MPEMDTSLPWGRLVQLHLLHHPGKFWTKDLQADNSVSTIAGEKNVLLSIFSEFYLQVDMGGIHLTKHRRINFTVLRMKILIRKSNMHILFRERFLNAFILGLWILLSRTKCRFGRCLCGGVLTLLENTHLAYASCSSLCRKKWFLTSVVHRDQQN